MFSTSKMQSEQWVIHLLVSTECLARLGLKPVFVSAIGSDPLGAMLLKHCEEVKMVNLYLACEQAPGLEGLIYRSARSAGNIN